MKSISNKRKKILDQPAYWIEGINQEMFHHLVDYMEKNNLNKTQMAKKMGISKGRLSQILKTGNINFTVGKIVKIALAMDMFPDFGLMKKDDYYQREEESAIS